MNNPNDNIKRGYLNNRHKVVWLQKKNRYDFLMYLIKKGIETGRCIQPKTHIGLPWNHSTYSVLHLQYYCNGYYCYVDILVNDKEKEFAVKWDNEQIIRTIKNNFHIIDGSGISINDKW